MPHRLTEAQKTAGIEPVNVYELFPELSEDIDRRITHAETRLKFWIISAVMANAFAVIAATLPSVYYLGQMSEKLNAIVEDTKVSKKQLAARSIWMAQQEEFNRLVADRVKLPAPPTNHANLERRIED